MAGRKRRRSANNDVLECCSFSKRPTLKEFEFANTHTKPALLSTDPEAKKIRDACDYSVKITLEDAKAGTAPRQVRVYADGIYDMFHNGHARQLMQAKCLLQNAYLIVGVTSQKLTTERKGRTVMAGDDRNNAVRHCRYVDEVIPDAPWSATDDLLLEHKIDFVAHDDLPYPGGLYQTYKDRGMFLATERTEGISTTDIIANILKDYDMYVRRNLGRGYTAKQLNLGFIVEKKIILGEKCGNWVDKGKELVDKGQGLIHGWERHSKQFIANFLELFGKDGRITSWLQEGKTRMIRTISPTSDFSTTDDPNSPGSTDSQSPLCDSTRDSDEEGDSGT